MSTARFSLRLRVYHEDTDAGGIVYYANYLRFMERARTEWLRTLAAAQRQPTVSEGTMFVVREAHLQYLSPARLDDELEIDAVPTEVRRASLRIAQTVTRVGDSRPLVLGQIRLAVVDRVSARPAPLASWLHETLAPLAVEPR
ncbi:MAG TPA: tol-pal system-associated acyl-CoA thioesterase [Burkholderiaceae bacterium]|jgi:acyl-CoA thioester hydrolase|nr:tol-pal system-associated acyl-CoA thioesterase [Burkholderiaceae bacterium]